MEQLFTYRLKFEDDGLGVEKTVEFTAPDASEALIIAGKEASGRNVELWRGDERLCRLAHSEDKVWTLAPAK